MKIYTLHVQTDMTATESESRELLHRRFKKRSSSRSRKLMCLIDQYYLNLNNKKSHKSVDYIYKQTNDINKM